MSRDQDLIIAKFCGWTWNKISAYGPKGEFCSMLVKEMYWWLPYYSSSLDDMATAEARIAEISDGYNYAMALLDVVDPDADELDEILFAAITATAQQRADALCKVIERMANHEH